MLMEGKFTLKAPIQEVWDALLDPGILASCIPGSEEMRAIDDRTYESVVKQKVGPISVRFKFTTTLTEMDPPRYLKAVGRGADTNKAGTFAQETTVSLSESASGEVEVAYRSDVSLVGRLATFAERLMQTKSKAIAAEFTRSLQEKLEHRAAA